MSDFRLFSTAVAIYIGINFHQIDISFTANLIWVDEAKDNSFLAVELLLLYKRARNSLSSNISFRNSVLFIITQS